MAYVFPIVKLLTQAFLLYRLEKSAFPLTVRPDVNLLSFDRYSSHVMDLKQRSHTPLRLIQLN